MNITRVWIIPGFAVPSELRIDCDDDFHIGVRLGDGDPRTLAAALHNAAAILEKHVGEWAGRKGAV